MDYTHLINGYPFDSERFTLGEGYPLVRIRDLNSYEPEVCYSGPWVEEAAIRNGDILIGMDGDFNVGRWRGIDALLNQRMCCLRPRDSLNGQFLFYCLSFPLEVINDLKFSTTVKHLSSAEVRKIRFPFPPREEQDTIARFLDRETVKVDALVERKERLIELLQEKRTALITRAVTRGLDLNVRMKDSGVEWLGEIPERWERIRLKHVAEIASGFSPPDSFDRSVGRFPVYGANGLIGYCDEYLVTEDTLAVGRVGTSGSVNVIPAYSWISDNALLLRGLGENTDISWLRYVLECMKLGALASKNAQPLITGTFLRGQALPKLPLREQQGIAALLDRETGKIDRLTEKIGAAIGRLNEFRTALISAAVTGNIDVREEA